MKLHSHLVKSRHGIYYLRVQRLGIDRRISLHTKDFKVASIAAYNFGAKLAFMAKNKNTDHPEFASQHELDAIAEMKAQNRAIERVEAIIAKNREEELFQKYLNELGVNENQPTLQTQKQSRAQPTNLVTTTLNSTCLRDAISEYKLVLEKSKQALKSQKMALSTLENLASLIGADFNMNELDDEVIESVWLESRLAEVAGTTAKRDLSFIKKFMDWASDRKRMYCPALTLQFSAKGTHWKYFEADDLNSIFSQLSESSSKPWHFWVPILGLYTGARIGELAALKPEYFMVKSGVSVMHLEGTKTDASVRDIPIHNDLIELGLLEYVATRRDHKMLFEITRSAQNGWGAAATKWFTEHKKRCGIVDSHKVFHSFRHTIIDLMNQASVGDKAQCQYTGHAHGKDVHSAVYGRGKLSMQVMKEQVTDKIDFKQYCGFEFDESVYSSKKRFE